MHRFKKKKSLSSVMMLIEGGKSRIKTKKSFLTVILGGPWVRASEVLDRGYIFMTLWFKATFLCVIWMQFWSIAIFRAARIWGSSFSLTGFSCTGDITDQSNSFGEILCSHIKITGENTGSDLYYDKNSVKLSDVSLLKLSHTYQMY